MSMSPTQRTIRALKDQGMVCGIVEKWNRFAVRGNSGQRGVRQDLFGILDIIALDAQRGVMAAFDFWISGHFTRGAGVDGVNHDSSRGSFA